MQDKYCLPIIKPTVTEVLAVLDEQNKNYHYFEVWLEYLTDADDAFIRTLVERRPDRIILVFRRQQLAPMQLALSRRLAVVRLCHKQPIFVDLDLGSQKPELEMIAKEQLSVRAIVSHHNYEITPTQTELNRLVRRMGKHNPTIFKIAAFCNSPEDCVRLLDLSLKLRASSQRCIILGMGEHGFATRIFGTLWANEFIFAPLDQEGQSAPGQLTRQQLDTIGDIIKPGEQ